MGKLKPFYCYLIIIVFTFLLFYNSLKNEFVFDDESVIVNNSSITNLDNIPKYFTADEGFHKVIGRYYRPVVSASYAIDYYFWGLNPYGFHLTNTIIHIISCLLLFKILSLLFWRYKYRNLFSLFSALIFAVHPVHTEAVTWISGRTDSMVTMFFFASFLCYILFTREMDFNKDGTTIVKNSNKNYFYLILSLSFYLLGLLTKEMIITMPAVILLYDFIYRKKKLNYLKENYLTYLLFLLLTAFYLILRYELLKNIPERENYLYFIGKDFEITFSTMLKTVPVYFKLLVAPFPLIYHYNGVIPDAKSIIDTNVLLSLAFIVIFIYGAVFFYKRDSIVSFCILFFFITLLPVMNIIPTMNLMAERFLYLTSFALVLLICHLSLLGSSKRDFSFLFLGMVIIICLLSYLTFTRNENWKNNNTLYLSAKGVEGTVLLVNEGNIYANNQKYEEASRLFKRAIELRDNNLLAHHNLGLIYLIKGVLDSAEMKFKKGISIDSLAPDGYFQLASVYQSQNEIDSAINMLEKLQKIFPNYKESQVMLNTLKSTSPDDKKQVSKLSKEQVAANERINLLQRRSFQLYNDKKYEEAIADLEELIKLNNKDPVSVSGFINNIALCYSALNNNELEEKYFLEAVNKDPKNINSMNGLAAFYLKTNEIVKAQVYYTKVLAIDPKNEIARNKLDSLLSVTENK